ncbi:hypothetical protein [Azospirillum sp.]|uniref:hypothetical protein n=1 Tax=Azospirillum sp. TaxID=34012 RepID=UPI003D729E7B
MLDQILVNPAVQSGLLPLVLALVLCLAARPLRLRWGAAVAMGVAYLASHLITLGLPPLPPVSAQQKLLYVAVGLLALGVALDAAHARQAPRVAVMALAPVAALVWLALPVLMRGGAMLTWLELAGTALGAVVFMARLERQADKGVTLPVTLVAAAVGTGVVALLGGSASILQLALAVAAATGGYLLANWPRQRQPVGVAVLGLAALVPVLAGQLLLFTKASPLAVALLLPIVFADALADRAPVPAALRPVLLGALCLVPFLLAVAAAWFGAETPGAYTG